MQNKRELTFGEKLVGVNSNPCEFPSVTGSKQLFAAAIDQLNDLRETTTTPEQKRLCSVAITQIQDALMWSDKAYTWRD